MKRKRPVFPRGDYATLELYTPEREPVEVDLSDNTNQWGAHPGALRAVREAAAEDLTRYPDLYAGALREAAAERFGVGPGNVCTGCGSDDVLDSAFRVVAESGGCIAYAAPSFVMVETFARANGRTTRRLPWSDALADPERLLRDDPCLVYVCRPNNPTGVLCARQWVRELLDAAGPDGPLVVVDEAYAEFAPEGESFVREAAARSRLLVVRTLSKAFGLAGMRVGLGVGSPEVVGEVEKSRGPYKVGRLAEAAAVAALRDEEGWIADKIAECVRNREELAAALEARGFSPLPSASNFVFVPVGPGNAVRYARRLRERGVGVRGFPSADGVGDGIRVSVGPWPNMERFLAALDAVREDETASEREVVVELELDSGGAAP